MVEDIGLSWQEMLGERGCLPEHRVRSPGVEQAFKEFLERRGR